MIIYCSTCRTFAPKWKEMMARGRAYCPVCGAGGKQEVRKFVRGRHPCDIVLAPRSERPVIDR
jgi:hypothetical protein